jgi:hypothetical protein
MWRPEFDPRPFYVKFVVDRVSLDYVFLRVLRFSLVSIIPPVLQNNFDFNITHQKDKRAKPGNLQTQQWLFGYQVAVDINMHPHCFILQRVKEDQQGSCSYECTPTWICWLKLNNDSAKCSKSEEQFFFCNFHTELFSYIPYTSIILCVIFRCVRIIAKSAYYLHHVRLSVSMYHGGSH